MTDKEYLQLAIYEAKMAEMKGEIPIGAVIVLDGEVIARGYNQTITDHDPSGHAEIIALRRAGKVLKNHRMKDVSLYVTLEPCIMCTGALIQARIKRLIFGAYDLRAGACGTCFDLARHKQLNHQIYEVKGGILENECRTLLQNFFQQRRK